MSPNIHNSKNKNNILINNYHSKNVKKIIKEYQKFIKQNFEYVGDNFAYEARTIHYSRNRKKKGIYGKATDNQIKELSEEGIETQTLPWIDENKN